MGREKEVGQSFLFMCGEEVVFIRNYFFRFLLEFFFFLVGFRDSNMPRAKQKQGSGSNKSGSVTLPSLPVAQDIIQLEEICRKKKEKEKGKECPVSIPPALLGVLGGKEGGGIVVEQTVGERYTGFSFFFLLLSSPPPFFQYALFSSPSSVRWEINSCLYPRLQ